MNLVTGYDIQRAQGEAVGPATKKKPVAETWRFSSDSRPKPTFSNTVHGVRTNINSGRAIDLTNQSRWKFNEGFGMDLGLRYDPDDGEAGVGHRER